MESEPLEKSYKIVIKSSNKVFKKKRSLLYSNLTLDYGPFTELCIEHTLHYMLRSVYLSHLWGFTYDLHNVRIQIRETSSILQSRTTIKRRLI